MPNCSPTYSSFYLHIFLFIVSRFFSHFSYFPIFRVNDTFPSLKMDADGGHATHLIQCIRIWRPSAWQQIKMEFLFNES